MHKDRDAELVIAASLPLAELRRSALTADLLLSQPPRIELTDYSVRLVATVRRRGSGGSGPCPPTDEPILS